MVGTGGREHDGLNMSKSRVPAPQVPFSPGPSEGWGVDDDAAFLLWNSDATL